MARRKKRKTHKRKETCWRLVVPHEPTVSLCMIVKDEESRLPASLASVEKVVDEIIIVDTGSTDRTPQIAASFGARIFHHRWEADFSKHRNQSISYASGRWILIMDADEELDPESARVLKCVLRDAACPVVSVVVRSRLTENHFNEQSSPRIFRRDLGIHYEGIVHNQLVYNGQCLFHPSIVIWHHGYLLSEKRLREKLERTRKLLEEQIRRDPGYLPAHHNLAVNYYNQREWEKAAEAATKAIRILNRRKIREPGFSWTYYILANSLLYMERPEEAERWAEDALRYAPREPDSHWTAAAIAFARKDFEKVLLHSDRFIRLCGQWNRGGPRITRTGSHISNSISRSWEMYRMAGYASMALDRPKEAFEAFWKSMESSPRPLYCCERYGLFLFEKGALAAALRFLERIPVSAEASCQALIARGRIYELIDPQKAVDFYRRLMRVFEQEAEIPFREAEVLFRMGRFAEAASAFKRALSIDPRLVEGYLNLGVVCEKMADQKGAEACYREALRIRPNSEIAMLNLIVLYGRGGRFQEARQMVAELFSMELSSSFKMRLSGNLYFHLLLARIDLGCGCIDGFRRAGREIMNRLGLDVPAEASYADIAEGFRRLADLCAERGDTDSSRMAHGISEAMLSFEESLSSPAEALR